MNFSRKSPSPRIYTYKITFPHQGWWYWGWHKERKFGESYSGSPKTHKEKWDYFEWEMQILECFDCEVEAQRVENRLIRNDLNNPLCLNEHCGSIVSTETASLGGKVAMQKGGGFKNRETAIKAGKRAGRENVEQRRGMFGWTGEKFIEHQKKASAAANSQKWMCLVTGKISTAGPLSMYQRNRNIDTKLRKKV